MTIRRCIGAALGSVYDLLESEVGGDEEWSRRVQQAIRRLDEGSSSGRARVAVYSDSPSGTNAAASVVTSLLLDPFAEDEPTRRAIAQRHAEPHAGAEYVIRYAENTTREIDSLACNSPWLRDASIDLVEVLYSDAVVLVLDPIRLLDTPHLAEIVKELEHKPRVVFLVDGDVPGSLVPDTEGVDPLEHARRKVQERVREQLDSLWKRGYAAAEHGREEQIPRSLFINSEKGISAIHSLRRVISATATTPATTTPGTLPSEDGERRAFDEFQERYIASNLGGVSQSLLADIRTLTVIGGPTQTATHVLRRSLAYIEAVLTTLTAQSLSVRREASALRDAAEDEERDIRLAAESTWRRSLTGEMERTRDAVQRVLSDRFGGWRVITGRVERVEEEVAGQVVAHWGYAVTQQLAFDTGRLDQIHRYLSEKTDTLLRSFAAPPSHSSTVVPSTAPFYSPVLINSLSQLEQTHPITPALLTAPIHARRAQLLSFVVPLLQKRAYTTAWTAWSVAFASSSLSWTACVPLDLLSPATSLGMGLLGSVAAARWAVGAWLKAQKKFWADWQRVEQGLEHDLGKHLDEVVKARVLAKAIAGADGLDALVKKRMARVDEVDEKVHRVRQGL
ncbi:hypothetical protein QFC19_008548 [Naganishia cerealis]|uniref:Uncharacterized protein n=1 Tax=Naganishia cerealis TaxID=610337 RepID=A0ACC2V0U2_9TREE|nr:hypothetical protein QFC19_008548 [Naganishia cerealis]